MVLLVTFLDFDAKDDMPVKEQLAHFLFDHIPVGVGSKGVMHMGTRQVPWELIWMLKM